MTARVADVTLKIPRPLYEQLAQAIEGTGFRSVTEFGVYVLRDLVTSQGGTLREELGHSEITAVRRRLRSVGYLDS